MKSQNLIKNLHYQVLIFFYCSFLSDVTKRDGGLQLRHASEKKLQIKFKIEVGLLFYLMKQNRSRVNMKTIGVGLEVKKIMKVITKTGRKLGYG